LETYRKRVEKLACGFDLGDNPFAWQAFGRCYDKVKRKAVPVYLRQENFQSLKSAVGRASVVHDSLDNSLRKQPARSLDRFVLLDSQDWMTPEALRVLWSEIERTARPGARVIFRTGGEQSPVESVLPAIPQRSFRYEHAKSRELTHSDRSCIYGGFHLYIMED
jgi:S-adenosylmethionine-diacylglycerol 3-amino-3-carboxypropyl transferase